MNSEFYKQLLKVKREKEISKRELASIIGVSYAMIIEFFDTTKPFRVLSEKTMSKINNKLGIPYEVMEDYNDEILKEREG
jgi:hypothetical protein